MIIYYEANNFKYETEAVMKLFCPLESFEFVYDNTPTELSGDYCVISAADSLCVKVSLKGAFGERSCPLPRNSGDKEQELCRMLFNVMSELTGIRPEWGCLTGIRPVKKVNALISRGLDADGVYNSLHEEYYISRRKSDLSYLTAVTQDKALEELDPESYSLYVGIPFCPTG